MKFYLIASLLIYTILVINGSRNLAQAGPIDWKKLDKKVYLLSGDILDPSETLGLLKILEKQYSTLKGEKSTSKHQSIKNLLRITEMIQEQCENIDKTFEIIYREFSFNSRYPNLVAFLTHYRDIQFSICQETLNNRLQHDIELLPKSIGDNFKKFKESVLAANPFDYPRGQIFKISDRNLLIKGIAHYLEQQQNTFDEKLVNAHSRVDIYKIKFDNLIREPCNRIMNTEPISVQEYRVLARDTEMVRKLGSFAREWMENSNLCYSIFNGEGGINTIRDFSMVHLFRTSQRNNNRMTRQE